MTKIFTYSEVAAGILATSGPFIEKFSGDLSDLNSQMGLLIRQALNVWEDATDLFFIEVPDSGQPFNVGASGEIRFFSVEHVPNQFVAYAVAQVDGEPGSRDIMFSQAYAESFYADDTAALNITIHEIGHVLGLEHSMDEDSVVYPDVTTNVTLSAQDQVNVTALHGDAQPLASLMAGEVGTTTAAYRAILGREPDAEGFAFWVNNGSAVDGLLASPEALLSGPVDEVEINATYQALMGRQAEAAAIDFWCGTEADDFITAVAASSEVQSHLIADGLWWEAQAI